MANVDSTGEAVDGKPANFQLRFWDLTSGQQIGRSLYDHGGSIRSIAATAAGFVTSSNDVPTFSRYFLLDVY